MQQKCKNTYDNTGENGQTCTFRQGLPKRNVITINEDIKVTQCYTLRYKDSRCTSRVAREAHCTAHYLLLHDKFVQWFSLSSSHYHCHRRHAGNEAAFIGPYSEEFLLQESPVIISLLLRHLVSLRRGRVGGIGLGLGDGLVGTMAGGPGNTGHGVSTTRARGSLSLTRSCYNTRAQLVVIYRGIRIK